MIASDADLAWSTTDYVDMKNESGETIRYFMIKWRGEPCFWWYQDEIRCAGPNEEQVTKLVQLARVLKAHVVGDDGEVYPQKQHETLPKQRSNSPEIKPWPLWKKLIAAFLFGCVLLALKLLILGP